MAQNELGKTRGKPRAIPKLVSKVQDKRTSIKLPTHKPDLVRGTFYMDQEWGKLRSIHPSFLTAAAISPYLLNYHQLLPSWVDSGFITAEQITALGIDPNLLDVSFLNAQQIPVDLLNPEFLDYNRYPWEEDGPPKPLTPPNWNPYISKTRYDNAQEIRFQSPKLWTPAPPAAPGDPPPDSNDPASPPTVSVGNTSGTVSASTVLFPVTLSAPSVYTTQVAYRTVDGTAKSGYDYIATAGKTIFAAGETVKYVPVSIYANHTTLSTKTFDLTLASPSKCVLGTSTGTCTLTDNAPGDDPQGENKQKKPPNTKKIDFGDDAGKPGPYVFENPIEDGTCIPIGRVELYPPIVSRFGTEEMIAQFSFDGCDTTETKRLYYKETPRTNGGGGDIPNNCKYGYDPELGICFIDVPNGGNNTIPFAPMPAQQGNQYQPVEVFGITPIPTNYQPGTTPPEKKLDDDGNPIPPEDVGDTTAKGIIYDGIVVSLYAASPYQPEPPRQDLLPSIPCDNEGVITYTFMIQGSNDVVKEQGYLDVEFLIDGAAQLNTDYGLTALTEGITLTIEQQTLEVNGEEVTYNVGSFRVDASLLGEGYYVQVAVDPTVDEEEEEEKLSLQVLEVLEGLYLERSGKVESVILPAAEQRDPYYFVVSAIENGVPYIFGNGKELPLGFSITEIYLSYLDYFDGDISLVLETIQEGGTIFVMNPDKFPSGSSYQFVVTETSAEEDGFKIFVRTTAIGETLEEQVVFYYIKGNNEVFAYYRFSSLTDFPPSSQELRFNTALLSAEKIIGLAKTFGGGIVIPKYPYSYYGYYEVLLDTEIEAGESVNPLQLEQFEGYFREIYTDSIHTKKNVFMETIEVMEPVLNIFTDPFYEKATIYQLFDFDDIEVSLFLTQFFFRFEDEYFVPDLGSTVGGNKVVGSRTESPVSPVETPMPLPGYSNRYSIEQQGSLYESYILDYEFPQYFKSLSFTEDGLDVDIYLEVKTTSIGFITYEVDDYNYAIFFWDVLGRERVDSTSEVESIVTTTNVISSRVYVPPKGVYRELTDTTLENISYEGSGRFTRDATVNIDSLPTVNFVYNEYENTSSGTIEGRYIPYVTNQSWFFASDICWYMKMWGWTYSDSRKLTLIGPSNTSYPMVPVVESDTLGVIVEERSTSSSNESARSVNARDLIIETATDLYTISGRVASLCMWISGQTLDEESGSFTTSSGIVYSFGFNNDHFSIENETYSTTIKLVDREVTEYTETTTPNPDFISGLSSLAVDVYYKTGDGEYRQYEGMLSMTIINYASRTITLTYESVKSIPHFTFPDPSYNILIVQKDNYTGYVHECLRTKVPNLSVYLTQAILPSEEGEEEEEEEEEETEKRELVIFSFPQIHTDDAPVEQSYINWSVNHCYLDPEDNIIKLWGRTLHPITGSNSVEMDSYSWSYLKSGNYRISYYNPSLEKQEEEA